MHSRTMFMGWFKESLKALRSFRVDGFSSVFALGQPGLEVISGLKVSKRHSLTGALSRLGN